MSAKHFRSTLTSEKNLVTLVFSPGTGEVLAAGAWNQKAGVLKMDAAVGTRGQHLVGNWATSSLASRPGACPLHACIFKF